MQKITLAKSFKTNGLSKVVVCSLTTAIDVLTGTTGDDTFVGDNGSTSAADQVVGGAGNDTLKLYATTTMPATSGVENLEIYSATAATLDLSSTANADITSLTLNGYEAVAAVIYTIKQGDTISLIDALDATNGTDDVNIHGASTVTSAVVNVTNSGVDTTNDIELDFTGTGMKTVTINALGSEESFINIEAATTGVTLTSVIINATSDLTITDIDDATTINATDSTGKVALSSAVNKVTVTGGSGADTVTLAHAASVAFEGNVSLGAGDDKLVITSLNEAADIVDDKVAFSGGAGSDTIVMIEDLLAALGDLSAADTAKKGISGFEKLEISNTGADGETYDLTKLGINHVIVTADDAHDNIFKMVSGATVEFGTAVDVIGGTTDYYSIDLADKAGAGDVVNIVVKNTATTGVMQVAAVEVETINIDASASTMANTVHLKAANTTSLTLKTGATDLTVDLSDESGQANVGLLVSLVDASNSVGEGGVVFTADASNLAGITFLGSAGGDEFNGGVLSDVVTAGAGDDIIDVGAGSANTVNLGAGGADKIEINSLTGFTTVTGFSSNDDVDIENAEIHAATVVYTGQITGLLDLANENVLISTINASTTALKAGGIETIADFTNMTDVAAYLEEVLDVDNAEDVGAVLNNGTHSFIYHINVDEGTDDGSTGGAADTVDATDVTLLMVVENFILTGDHVVVS